MTYAAFIKKEFKDKWLDKACDTVNITNDLRMTVLVKDANRDPVFNEFKKHFAIWGEDVMIFLYAAMQNSEKDKKKETKEVKPTIAPDFAEEFRREAKRHEANRVQEIQRLEHIEKNKQMAEASAKLEKEIADRAKEIEEQRKTKEDLYKDVTAMSEALKQLKIQSARSSARSSAQSSRVQSRAASPTNSIVAGTRTKLKYVLAHKKLKEQRDKAIAQINELEEKRIRDSEIKNPEDGGSSSSSHTEDSESDSTASETEDKEFDLPTENQNKKEKKRKESSMNI